MRHTLRASAETVHVGFYDYTFPPALEVNSGDLVEVHTLSGRAELYEFLGIMSKFPKEIDEIRKAKGKSGHLLLGPIAVRDASPEDTLEVSILEVKPADYGTNIFNSSGGSIPELFPYQKAKLIPIKRDRGIFSDQCEVPIQPFFGHLGVAPAVFPGRVPSQIPGPHGGNLDNKELVASSKLYLPIFNQGALFSLGDGHASQGDGEVNLTALETSMSGLIQLKTIKNMKTKWPMAETSQHFVPMGFGTTLDAAFKMALRNSIDFLTLHRMNRDDAYMLCSLSVNFHITQTVNFIKGVHAMIPKSVVSNFVRSIA